MKLDLDPNSSSKDSAEECKGAAKVSSDAGGKVGAHKDLFMYLATFSKWGISLHMYVLYIILRQRLIGRATPDRGTDLMLTIYSSRKLQ